MIGALSVDCYCTTEVARDYDQYTSMAAITLNEHLETGLFFSPPQNNHLQ